MGIKICAFYTYKIFDYLEEYDYFWRLDEDGMLVKPLQYNPFERLVKESSVYGYLYIFKETHTQTIETLYPFLNDYFEQHHEHINTEVKIDDLSIFASNFMITKVAFWKQKNIKNIFKCIKESKGIQTFRWGDAPIQDFILRAFGKEQIIKFDNISYFHQSHNELIT